MSEAWVFWVVLAGLFLCLAVFSGRALSRVREDAPKWAVWSKDPLFAAGVADSLAGILVVEVVGFALAAAAAFFSAFS